MAAVAVEASPSYKKRRGKALLADAEGVGCSTTRCADFAKPA